MGSIVGLATLRLEMHAPDSLKDKRSVSKRLIARIRHRFNVAVAETATLDSRSTLTLGIVCISNSERHAMSMLEKVIAAVDEMRIDAELVDHGVELV